MSKHTVRLTVGLALAFLLVHAHGYAEDSPKPMTIELSIDGPVTAGDTASVEVRATYEGKPMKGASVSLFVIEGKAQTVKTSGHTRGDGSARFVVGFPVPGKVVLEVLGTLNQYPGPYKGTERLEVLVGPKK